MRRLKLFSTKRHEVKLMEQLEAQERKVRSTKAILNEQSAKVAQLEAKRLVTEGTPLGSDLGRRLMIMIEPALCILTTSWPEGSMRMIYGNAPRVL